MSLPLGKLALIVGAGLVGSVLAKEGRTSTLPDIFTGTFKIVWKQLRRDDPTTSSSKPKNDALMREVNSLREQLQLVASNRSVTIVTGDRSGYGKYSVVIIVAAVGGGFIWWKGWKLSDMMFATRGGLNDACNAVAQQLENVYASISVTKRHLSSRVDRVDAKIDECADTTVATRDEVCGLRGDLKVMGVDVQSVHHAVRSLETKISRIEGRQNETNFGVGKLVTFVRNIELSRSREQQIEGAGTNSSRPALELPPTPPSRAVSLPTNALVEPPSPSTSNGPLKKQATFPTSSQSSVSGSGLKELHGMFGDTGESSQGGVQDSSNGSRASEESNGVGPSRNGTRYSGFGSFFTRSLSTMR